jgi:hypothetical protein
VDDDEQSIRSEKKIFVYLSIMDNPNNLLVRNIEKQMLTVNNRCARGIRDSTTTKMKQ